MWCKKVVGCLLVVGATVMVYSLVKGDCNMNCIKKKGKQLTKKMDDFFNNIDENSLKKYKDNLIKEYSRLKYKIDNLTVKDIKDAGSEMIENILDSLDEFKSNLLSYS